MDRLDDFRDWLRRKLCNHAQAPEFREITNTWDGKEHYNAFWECPRCGEVLSSEYMWTLPEGSKVILPDGHDAVRGESMITQHILNKGTMQNCMYMARAKTAADEHTGNGPIYDFYLEDGVVGSCQGPDSLAKVAASGQAMIVQQRPGTGTLEKPES